MVLVEIDGAGRQLGGERGSRISSRAGGALWQATRSVPGALSARRRSASGHLA
jgi:hypothetical protein